MPTSTDPAARSERPAAASPPPAPVPGNVWTAIDVADLGALTPRAAVSVVVVGPDPEGLTPLTLAALATQSYPGSLTSVVVETGEESGGSLREGARGLALQLLPPGGGAAAAEGEVVLFVPAGSLPERELVEAHARWHHAVGDAVSVGSNRRVHAAGLDPAIIEEAQRGDGLERLLASRLENDDPDEAALETFLERTHGLTERRPDLFRVAARGTVAVRVELLRAARELARARSARPEPDHGLARLDLAYRLDCVGSVFVPEPAARSYASYHEPWIGGAAAEEGPAGSGDVDPRVASRIPVRGFRARGSGRVFDRPAMVVRMPGEGRGAAEVLEAVDAVLRGHLSDLRVSVELSSGHPDRALVEAACASDPRVEVGPGQDQDRSESPYEVTMPAGAVPGDGTFDAIHDLMTRERLGSLHLTVPGRADRLPLSRLAGRLLRRPTVGAVATGPRARAARLGAHRGEPTEEVLASLFEERRADGAALGVRRAGASDPGPPEDGALGPAGDLAHERAEHLRFRARAATTQVRLDRQAQRLYRERFRSGHERVHAERLEARLARVDPRYWVRWKGRRVARRLAAQPKRASRRVQSLREPLYRLKQSRTRGTEPDG